MVGTGLFSDKGIERNVGFWIPLLLSALALVLGFVVSRQFLWGLVLFGPLLLIALWDMVQTTHSLRRNVKLLKVDASAVHKVLLAMRDHQHVGQATGAVHAAAFCSYNGDIVLLREDVGRHNALDKLIGALGRGDLDRSAGFAVLSARCSQELVKKTLRAGIPMLVTISAPSSLAVARAREGRLTLLVLARNDSALIVNDPHRLF